MHCDLKGQQKIAEILEHEIKDQIYVLPENHESNTFYPSPESLKRKFVIKSKGTVPASAPSQNALSLHAVPNQLDITEPSILDSDNDDPCINLHALKRTICQKVDIQKCSRYRTEPFDSLAKAEKNIGKHRSLEADHNAKNQFINANIFNNVGSNENEDLSHHKIVTFDQNFNTVVSHKVETQVQVFTVVGENESVSKSNICTEVNGTPSKVDLDDVVLGEGKKHKKEKKVKSYPGLTKYYTLLGSKIDFSPKRAIWEISSLSEEKVRSMYKSKPRELIDFCKKYFVRVFPLGTRVDSSNYDPVKAWAAGGQMVALNYQTSDEAMLLNYAKYVANGATGYILKPEYLTSATLLDPRKAKYPNEMTVPKMKLKIRVISGQQFHFEEAGVSDITDPFVEIKVKGIDVDEEINQAFKTHVIKDNGFNPIWSTDDKACETEFTLIAPELATLVVKVYDADLTKKTKLAWYAIEVPHIVEGHRMIPMLNTRFDQIPNCYLYVHIKIEHLKC